MVNETVVVCDVVPLVPLTVMVRVPRVARLDTRIVIVELPAPVIEVGLKLTVTRLPWPEADNATAELNPPLTEDVTVTLPDVPRLTVMEEGDALSENPPPVPVTVSETVVVCTVLPDVPVTVIE